MFNYLLIILVILLYLCINRKEQFQTYILKPFNYVKTGAEPIYFYKRNRYRKPYRWPFKFYSSYPYPNMSPLE